MATQAFMRTYAHPEEEAAQAAFAARSASYDTLWAYYTNEAFTDLARWQAYRSRHRLYRNHRSLYNPTRRLVDFYAGAIYPGMVTAAPDRYGDAARLAYPLADATPPALRNALDVLWQWSNWQSTKGVLTRWGAALGDVLIEAVDDLEREKVLPALVWPGHVADLTLDPTGNVKAYRLEYKAVDEREQSYTYAKAVDGDWFRVFREREPVQEWRNEYGFVPAVWVKHADVGGQHGQPALRGIEKVDELNGLVSQAHDNLRKMMGAPLIVASEGVLSPLYGDEKRGGTAEAQALGRDEAELLNVWRVAGSANILSVPLDPQAVLGWVERLLGEIEHDHPELTFYQQLRGMGEVSGVAASRLMGDVEGLVLDAQSAYDMQCTKLFQMCIAIAGWRVNTRAWGRAQGLTRAQEVFRPFGLDSYAAGDLDFTILPRPLVPMNEKERMEMERERLALDGDRSAREETRGLAASVAERLRSAAPSETAAPA